MTNLVNYVQVLQAKLLYGEIEEKKKFTFDHCWEILQHRVKWQDSIIQKKRTSSNNSPSPYSPSEVSKTPISLSSNHDPVEDDIVDLNVERPIGKKAEKESRKKSKIEDTSNICF